MMEDMLYSCCARLNDSTVNRIKEIFEEYNHMVMLELQNKIQLV